MNTKARAVLQYINIDPIEIKEEGAYAFILDQRTHKTNDQVYAGVLRGPGRTKIWLEEADVESPLDGALVVFEADKILEATNCEIVSSAPNGGQHAAKVILPENCDTAKIRVLKRGAEYTITVFRVITVVGKDEDPNQIRRNGFDTTVAFESAWDPEIVWMYK